MEFDFNKAVFTYAISNDIMNIFRCHYVMKTQQLVINYTEATSIYNSLFKDQEVTIIGLCIDSYELIERENIAFEIVRLPEQTIEAVYEFSNRLSGKYIIVYSNQVGCYVFGDATCSIPLNYSGNLKDGAFCISPFDKMTANYFCYEPDNLLYKMRESADPAQTMPGDLTPYKQVKALLPNQYLNVLTGETVWVKVQIPDMTFEEIINRSVYLSICIAKQFLKYYNLICPLTSGYDSRVVLSLLQQVIPDIECYTTNFASSKDESDDIRIATTICQKEKIDYTIFGYYELPRDSLSAIEQFAGLINSAQTIREAYSYIIEAGDKSRINGNIIGQIGKSSVTNCVPDSVATASFLTCKIHNRDKACKAEMKKYRDELKHSGHQICDLFVYENRCGRWGGQEEALYSLCGMNSLNIFNCKEIIFSWMAISRKKRVNKEIHLSMIRKTNPDLLIEPFNPDDKLFFLRNNWIIYYIATFAKQILITHNIQCD